MRITLKALVVTIVTMAVITGGAVGATLITGKDIKNRSIGNIDIKPGTVKIDRLSAGVQRRLNAKLVAGPKGDAGTPGPKGDPGAPGSNGVDGADGAPGADAITKVTSLLPDPTGDGVAAPAWGARTGTCGAGNAGTVALTDTIKFGVYDNGDQFSAVTYNGFNGKKIKDIAYLAYTAKYDQAVDQNGGTPYFRIYTQDGATPTPGDHAIIFSPNTNAPVKAGEWNRWTVTNGSVRYDDDAGNLPDIPWSELVADHGDDTITQIRIAAGCAGAFSNLSTGFADNLAVDIAGKREVFAFGS